MFKLHIVQARYGDCFLLEYGTAAAPRYMLIDGGPQGVYEENLRPLLREIAGRGGRLDFAVLSHVDDDHVVGLLALLGEIRQQRDGRQPETIAIGQIWHNSFSQTLGSDVEARFSNLVRNGPTHGEPPPAGSAPAGPMRDGSIRGAPGGADRTMRDVAKGDELTRAARTLGIPINEEFDPGRIVAPGLTTMPIKEENLSIWIVAPNQANLQNLKQEWLEWLAEQEEAESGVRADTRVPNLSSIMFLAKADGKSILLTGDGRGDHLLDGLQQAGLLDPAGKLHVDVLKLPHHGSRHNISKEFLQAVTADRYIVSASGRYRHPSRQTLEWIAKVAREQGRAAEIVLTNHTSAVDHLIADYDPGTYGYSLTEMPPGDPAMVLDLGQAGEAVEEWVAPETGEAESAGTQIEGGQPRRPQEGDTSGTRGPWIRKVLDRIKDLFCRRGGDVRKRRKWTFMVYLAGDNNLSAAGERDLQEMAAVGSTTEVNIVAEFDRAGDYQHSKRYAIEKDNLREVVDLGETDCGDPNVLLDFIRWSAENYPAERYALILWNHGGGWAPAEIDQIATEVKTKEYSRDEGADRSGSSLGKALFRSTWKRILTLDSPAERAICTDDGSGHSLDTVELGQVVRLAAEAFGQPIDLMGMDACLMSNFEVAYQVRDHVQCIVASEQTEPFDGWPYTEVLQKLVDEPEIATSAFGAHIVDAYMASYANTNKHVTQSALDMSKVDRLAGPLDQLADALIAHPPALEQGMWKAQRRSKSFADGTMWDLAHLCQELEELVADGDVKTATRHVRQALEPGNFVIAEGHRGHDLEHCRGVSIYLKEPEYGVELSRYYAQLDYAAEHRWDEMLSTYHGLL